ncbi:sensor domain CHASE2-containing protein [Nitrosospira sp. Nl5]|uniref:CHASE2 domain-containing protein n=1 Tax=Nitrosospira sp. Nl5 TaxID=200120 RepID=UPI000884431C|nr:CHASE2 domain-containing protein [Nitrosospira sp. Nl5]SCY31696.1 sensor domain CHASE2-containing protein [Nitrosospira sp. Nl5]
MGYKNEKTEESPDAHHRFFSFSNLHHYIVNDWPQIVLVAAIVTTIHYHTHWLHQIDRYAYVVIGHLSSLASSPRDSLAVVVAIDGETHKREYLERSPLNRCVLLSHLKEIYDSSPSIVVIDLDLSPALKPPESGGDDHGWGDIAKCEKALEEMIQAQTKAIPTILAGPFEEREVTARGWAGEMENAGVRFGNAKLPLEYGVVLTYYSHPTALAQVARASYCAHAADKRCGNALPGISRPFEEHKPMLNFQPSSSLAPKAISDGISTHQLGGKVVFLGATYGGDDRFLTPMDEKYGVELHALAFASTFERVIEHEKDYYNVSKLIVDLGWGLMFGYVIAWCWHRYFTFRLNISSPTNQLLAPWLIFRLLGLVVLGMLIFSYLSLLILENFGVWASPIPIAVGMLFESFVSGSVAQAIRVGRDLTRERSAARGEAEIQLEPGAGTGSDCLLVDSRSLCESFKRFVYLDFKCLWRRNKPAVYLLASRRLIWLILVLLSIVSTRSHGG